MRSSRGHRFWSSNCSTLQLHFSFSRCSSLSLSLSAQNKPPLDSHQSRFCNKVSAARRARGMKHDAEPWRPSAAMTTVAPVVHKTTRSALRAIHSTSGTRTGEPGIEWRPPSGEKTTHLLLGATRHGREKGLASPSTSSLGQRIVARELIFSRSDSSVRVGVKSSTGN